MFFTPPPIAARLLNGLADVGADYNRQVFCDPACGGAAFLTPIALRMREALVATGARSSEVLKHLQAHLWGADVDATLCELSRHFLLMALRDDVLAADTIPTFDIVRTDSLFDLNARLGRQDVVVCNPPFRKVEANELARYRKRYGAVIEAQPNLYTFFMQLCINLLGPSGICGLLTPTSFLSGQNFSRLRQQITAETHVVTVGRVDDRKGVFVDVQQDTALTLLRRRTAGERRRRRTAVTMIARDGTYRSVGHCVLSTSGAAWFIPQAKDDLTLLTGAARSSKRLADYGYAPRIGSFVWNRDTRPTYSSAKQARASRGRAAVPLLWSSNIKPKGKLAFNGTAEPGRESCYVNMGSLTHPSVVRRPSVLLQRVTANSQPRRLVGAAVTSTFIKAHGGFVGENHTVILEQIVDDPALTPVQMAKLLGTATLDRLYRCISGATNVSVFELEQMFLPDPQVLKRLLAEGRDVETAARLAILPGKRSDGLRRPGRPDTRLRNGDEG